MKEAAKQARVDLPQKTSKEQQAAYDRLEKLTGRDFDAAFVRHAIASHEKSLALHQRGAKEMKNAHVRKYAEQTVPVIREHLKAARGLSEGRAAQKEKKER